MRALIILILIGAAAYGAYWFVFHRYDNVPAAKAYRTFREGVFKGETEWQKYNLAKIGGGKSTASVEVYSYKLRITQCRVNGAAATVEATEIFKRGVEDIGRSSFRVPATTRKFTADLANQNGAWTVIKEVKLSEE